MKLTNGSGLKLEYNDGNGEMEVQATMNGTAGFYWVQGSAKKFNLSSEIQSMTSGFNFVYDLLKFEDFTINSPDDATNCKGKDNQSKGALSGIKSLNFGTWGLLSENSAGAKKQMKEALEKGISRGLQAFPVSIGDGLGFNCFVDPDDDKVKYRMIVPIEVNLMPDDETKESGKTAGIKASTVISFISAFDNGDFSLDGFELNCMLVEGEFGPLKLKGGINILRDDSKSTTAEAQQGTDAVVSKWGSGYKGGFDIEVLGVNVKAVGQYGMTRYDLSNAKAEVIDGVVTGNQEKYRYFFIDLEATLPAGIPVPPPSPTSVPVLYIVGAGGGFLYNMDLEPTSYLFEESGQQTGVDNEKNKEGEPRKFNDSSEIAAYLRDGNDYPDNDLCKADDDMLKPGVNLSGMTYRPNQGAYGGNLSLIGTTLPPEVPQQIIAGDVTLRVGIEENNVGTL